jgi:hypothetical protein
METPLREAETNFSRPVRQITTMVVVLVLVAIGAYFAWSSFDVIFRANPGLNSVIILVFVIGVFACFWQLAQILASVRWIDDFANHVPGHDGVRAPQLLAPLAALLRARGARSQISGSASTSILDSVATRIDEERDVTRYLTNLLIFLGLLGTFWGLATTVPAVVETIRSLAPKEGETATQVFEKLMGGLQSQLGGMGMAFSSSLLGLFGSLVLGLLELFASHGQNRFYRELEEWLSSITRIGFASADGESGFDQGVVVGVLDHMAEQIESIQLLFTQSEAGRVSVEQRLGALIEAVGRVTVRLEGVAGTGTALARLAEAQDRSAIAQDRMIETMERAIFRQDKVAEALDRTAEAQDRAAKAQERALVAQHGREDATGEHVDAESRMRLRSIDVQLLRILEEISAGRQESITDLRGDLAALTAAIRQLSRGTVPPIGRG